MCAWLRKLCVCVCVCTITCISILRYGPLIRMWCMRYEAKHSYFKRMSQVMHNFKNISQSLAKHHQRLMCYRMPDKSTYLATKSPGKCVCVCVCVVEPLIKDSPRKGHLKDTA